MIWILQVNGNLNSCGLQVHFQNWPPAADLAWFINGLIILISLKDAFFCSSGLLSRSWKILSVGSQSVFLLSLMSRFYKRTLYCLSTGGGAIEAVCLGRRKFMGCEGQFERPKPESPFSIHISPIEQWKNEVSIFKKTKLLFKGIWKLEW